MPPSGVDTVPDALACFPAGRGIFSFPGQLRTIGYTSCTVATNCRSHPRNMCCVPDNIDRVIVDIERFSEAAERLAERLLQQAAWSAEDIERLRAGMSLTETCGLTNSSDRSRTMTRDMAEFEASRRAIRSSTVLALLDEGTSVTGIGKVFGVSRQLANRLVKDARASDREAPTPV